MRLIKALETEEAELHSELSKDARYRRLMLVRQTLAEYRAPATAATTAAAVSEKPSSMNGHALAANIDPSRFKSVIVPLTKAEKLRREIQAHLAANGKVHRRALLAHLIQVGLLPDDGRRAMNQLSVYLAGWSEFAANGKGFIELCMPPVGEFEIPKGAA